MQSAIRWFTPPDLGGSGFLRPEADTITAAVEIVITAHQHLLYHIVFSIKERQPFFKKDAFREEVWAYMAGVCKNLGGFASRIGGHFDHAHLLVYIPAKVAVAEFVGKVKANTSKHINDSAKLSLARWLWSIYREPLAIRSSNSIYRQTPRASRETDFSR